MVLTTSFLRHVFVVVNVALCSLNLLQSFGSTPCWKAKAGKAVRLTSALAWGHVAGRKNAQVRSAQNKCSSLSCALSHVECFCAHHSLKHAAPIIVFGNCGVSHVVLVFFPFEYWVDFGVYVFLSKQGCFGNRRPEALVFVLSACAPCLSVSFMLTTSLRCASS